MIDSTSRIMVIVSVHFFGGESAAHGKKDGQK